MLLLDKEDLVGKALAEFKYYCTIHFSGGKKRNSAEEVVDDMLDGIHYEFTTTFRFLRSSVWDMVCQ